MEKRIKKIVILVVVLFLVSGTGLFCWNKVKEPKGSPQDYVVKETETGRVVENKKAGLKVRVPEGWLEEKIGVEEGSMVFYTSDAQGYREGKIRPPLKKGCIIEVAVVYKKMSFDEIKDEIKEMHNDPAIESDKFEIINLNNILVLKNEFEDKILGWVETLYIPKEEQLYSFCVYTSSDDKQKCSEEFDKFLENILIE